MKNLDPTVEEGTGDFIVGLNEFHKAIDATLSDDAIRIKNRLWIVTTFKFQDFDEEILDIERYLIS